MRGLHYARRRSAERCEKLRPEIGRRSWFSGLGLRLYLGYGLLVRFGVADMVGISRFGIGGISEDKPLYIPLLNIGLAPKPPTQNSTTPKTF